METKELLIQIYQCIGIVLFVVMFLLISLNFEFIKSWVGFKKGKLLFGKFILFIMLVSASVIFSLMWAYMIFVVIVLWCIIRFT